MEEKDREEDRSFFLKEKAKEERENEGEHGRICVNITYTAN